MLSEKPFVHLIQTPYGYYIFDVNTNSIVNTTKSAYNYLQKQQNGISDINEKTDNETEKLICKYRMQGYLSSNKPKEIVHPMDEYLEYHLNNKLNKVTLQITQKCNLRCLYCPYTEATQTESGMQRKHSNMKMPFEVAKKAIDFLISHSRDLNVINIGFYGGEPLLELDLMNSCMEYAEKVSEGKTLTFNFTTNGTLLDDRAVEILSEHDVSVTISLDGPREIHDKHRRFAGNGFGSFNKIEENIERIKEKHPEFMKRISFNVVIDPKDDFSCVNNFLVNYELFKEVRIRGAIIDDTYAAEKISFNQDFTAQSNYELFKAFLVRFNRIDAEKVSPIARRRYTDMERLAGRLGCISKLPEKTHHSGPCIPGAKKLFIDTQGNFYPCERVSETSQVMKIGNINTGFDIGKARDVLNVGKLTSEKCKNCWAISYCTLCAKHADNISDFSPELKTSHCNRTRKNVENSLKNLIALNEVELLFDRCTS